MTEYRSWHKGIRKMCDVFYLDWDLEEAGICIEGACTRVPFSQIILCRYIGSMDKNGKSIFENDIVRCDKRGAAFHHSRVVWNSSVARYDIVAMDCAFPMMLEEKDGISIYGLDYEVIGSFYDTQDN